MSRYRAGITWAAVWLGCTVAALASGTQAQDTATAGATAPDPGPAPAAESTPEPAPAPEAVATPAVADDVNEVDAEAESERIFDTRLYGFIDGYWEVDTNSPSGVDAMGQTVREQNNEEFDVANLNVMVQGTIYGRYRYYLNLAAPGSGGVISDEPVAVRNAWVEVPLYRDFIQFRIGKTYRRFGLYNEILDAVPTFIGIEPPEMLDKDHLMITRTTNLMIHGSAAFGENTLSYALMSGNDERDGEQIPLGLDVHFDVGSLLRFGGSAYHACPISLRDPNPCAVPGVAPGDGSPRGGVVNWMEQDRYWVVDFYAQLTFEGLTLQAEYARATHDAVRNADGVLAFLDSDGDGMFDGNPNGNVPSPILQRRFYTGDLSMPLDRALVPTAAKYVINTFYVRLGYEIETDSAGTFVPYAQFDYYSNPEIIKEKDFGGDNEAGVTDDGSFIKLTLGAVYRPIEQVAVKFDVSDHVQQFNSATEHYFDFRFSLSYQWELEL